MCYGFESRLKNEIENAIAKGDKMLEFHLRWELSTFIEKDKLTDYYYVSGFDHPDVPILIRDGGIKYQMAKWGLIPAWVKEEEKAAQFANKTLNARGETLFEKASFKDAVKTRRCIVPLHSFYEFHHLGKMAYPFRISPKKSSVFLVAGLWENNGKDIDGNEKITFSIVTTKGNETMQFIHNNPKMAEPRMPLILTEEAAVAWLNANSEEKVKALLQPFPSEMMESHPVWKLNGKNGSGNTEKAIEKFTYPELEMFLN